MDDDAKRSITPWVALAALALIGILAYLVSTPYLRGTPVSTPVLLFIVILVIAAILGYLHFPTEKQVRQEPADSTGRT
ncbi:MAG TPA: hypothetical protein VMH38_00535 [Thermoplasmata archaeon]|nr:hypothetical protein [Thermoplasmata archaeon]